MDLCLFDSEPSKFVGANEDFIFSGRIDNLVSVYAQFQGIADFAANAENLRNSKDIAVGEEGMKDIIIAVGRGIRFDKQLEGYCRF